MTKIRGTGSLFHFGRPGQSSPPPKNEAAKSPPRGTGALPDTSSVKATSSGNGPIAAGRPGAGGSGTGGLKPDGAFGIEGGRAGRGNLVVSGSISDGSGTPQLFAGGRPGGGGGGTGGFRPEDPDGISGGRPGGGGGGGIGGSIGGGGQNIVRDGAAPQLLAGGRPRGGGGTGGLRPADAETDDGDEGGRKGLFGAHA